MSNIAIFGGTFNPIHNGHLNLIKNIQNTVQLDKIILMPTNIPPHKKAENLAGDEDRLNMCRIVAENFKNVEVSDYEIKRGDISYTVNTLRYFHKKFPNDKLFFIMGSDMFLSLHTWYCYEEILSLATIITASREENELNKLNEYKEKLGFNAKVIIISSEPYIVSSSYIRNAIKTRKDFTCYLPERIVQYISDNKIYTK